MASFLSTFFFFLQAAANFIMSYLFLKAIYITKYSTEDILYNEHCNNLNALSHVTTSKVLHNFQDNIQALIVVYTVLYNLTSAASY